MGDGAGGGQTIKKGLAATILGKQIGAARKPCSEPLFTASRSTLVPYGYISSCARRRAVSMASPLMNP